MALDRSDQPVDYGGERIWEPGLGAFKSLRNMALTELEWIARHAKRHSVRLKAVSEILGRTDPLPRPADVQMHAVVGVQIALESGATQGRDSQAPLPAGSLEIHLPGN